ncbi:alpha-ketoglutarate-dependent dioxygenase AlkB [Muriicola sp. Z0-33]|uniref:alpha-ketoglutarate-dependent dioxygenase AlkB n=1 Tax=Muriicola sp. Z0-33 TaxID=2816957 RepID=UPI0022384B51|nr:alpha-ketoglutarate-dependent dioxygenase AlkB [Muriicola sp. Z0-33]MCW5518142.1 alpha-ketoglutarate-dependent dioxygenase AlkB [Muriicola sp. Z0-33]
MKLPLNCEAEYHSDFLELKEAEDLFFELNEVMKKISFYPQTVDGKKHNVNFGKLMIIDQYLFDQNRFPEKYWGVTRVWFGKLIKLKEKIEHFTNQKFQVCVLIYYPDGNSGVDFHSDYTAYGDTSIIPSISLGEEREFKFREKESENEFTTRLANGSLIIMGKYCQDRYEHSLPINPDYKNPRINLTFRKFGFEN